jgi:hypothetical protein
MKKLPHFKKNLSANLSFPGLMMGQNALRGGENGKPYFSSHQVQLAFIHVDPQAGLADPAKSGDETMVLVIKLCSRSNWATLFFIWEEGMSTCLALALQAFLILVNISAKGSVVFMNKSFPIQFQRLDFPSSFLFIFHLSLQATSYQLAFITPGISPLSASSLKQIRHNPKSRINPRGLPQR